MIVKYAIISDIHANLEAFSKAMEIISASKVDEIVCLGDIVGYGANPNECVELVQKECPIVVIGNHDYAALHLEHAAKFNKFARPAIEWTSQQLTKNNREWLSTLPYTERSDDLFFVHSSPVYPEEWKYVITYIDAAEALLHFSEKICFVGHSHTPGIFTAKGNSKEVNRDERYIINVGSIGQPRDGNPMLSFGIFDTEFWKYELVRSEYDNRTACDKIIKMGLPPALGNRLMYGV